MLLIDACMEENQKEQNQTNLRCSICAKSKPAYQCGLCQDALCKSCAQFLPETAFQYLPIREAKLQHTCYCTVCFDQNIQQSLNAYETVLEQAHEVLVFDKTQGKETRFIRRLEKPFVVENGLDEHDVTMRLAFMAAEKNYNSIIDVDIKATKIRDGSYQTTSYSGKAVPANVSDRKLMKDRSLRTNPN